MAFTNEELELASIDQIEIQETQNRAGRTMNLRARIFQTLKKARGYFAKQGSNGTKKICISMNAIGDANQLHYLNKMSVAQVGETLTLYGTLKATNGASMGATEPSSRVIGIMAHSLYQADELQKTGEAGFEDAALGSPPHKQAPRFVLVPNLATGHVAVNAPTL